MSIAASILPEFDHEMAVTRRVLERVPDDKLDWRPHPTSRTMGELATHVANLPHWVEVTLHRDSFDIAPPDAPPPRVEPVTAASELLARFDANVTAGHEAIAAADDAALSAPWSLLKGGKVGFTLPKTAVLRSFVMNHIIHHRAQLAVYFRIAGVAVPSIYGPSADEEPGM